MNASFLKRWIEMMYVYGLQLQTSVLAFGKRICDVCLWGSSHVLRLNLATVILSGTSCHLHSIEFAHSFRLACKYWKQPKVNGILGNVDQYSCVQRCLWLTGSDRTAIGSLLVNFYNAPFISCPLTWSRLIGISIRHVFIGSGLLTISCHTLGMLQMKILALTHTIQEFSPRMLDTVQVCISLLIKRASFHNKDYARTGLLSHSPDSLI